MKNLSLLGVLASACTLACTVAWAQDPVEVDAAHYSVEFENDHVRVLRISYGPGEKSEMHYHPAATAVFLTEQNVVFHMPDGTSVPAPSAGAGDTIWTGRVPCLLLPVGATRSNAGLWPGTRQRLTRLSKQVRDIRPRAG